LSGPEAQNGARGARVVVDDVRRVHPGPVVALDGVSLALEPGEFVALTGPSGSGKTSLLSLIGALDRPTSGAIEIDGTAIEEWETGRLHREVIGFVFQHHHLLAHLPARTNVEIPLIGNGLSRGERRERATELLKAVRLEHRLESLAVHLSGGERQRVAVARALANDPRLLLADEPTGALDSDDSQRILDLLAELRERRGMTMLMVTYDEGISRRADRRLYMRDGRLVREPVPSGAA
jgi:putative ABC transport system ATP-binding protein